MGSSMDVIDYPPHPETTSCPEYVTVLPSLEGCIQEHGIECATEVNDQQMTALHILCANPHVTGDCIRTYLHWALEAAEQQDSDGTTPFSVFAGMTLLSQRTGAFLLSWRGGTDACLPIQDESFMLFGLLMQQTEELPLRLVGGCGQGIVGAAPMGGAPPVGGAVGVNFGSGGRQRGRGGRRFIHAIRPRPQQPH